MDHSSVSPVRLLPSSSMPTLRQTLSQHTQTSPAHDHAAPADGNAPQTVSANTASSNSVSLTEQPDATTDQQHSSDLRQSHLHGIKRQPSLWKRFKNAGRKSMGLRNDGAIATFASESSSTASSRDQTDGDDGNVVIKAGSAEQDWKFDQSVARSTNETTALTPGRTISPSQSRISQLPNSSSTRSLHLFQPIAETIDEEHDTFGSEFAPDFRPFRSLGRNNTLARRRASARASFQTSNDTRSFLERASTGDVQAQWQQSEDPELLPPRTPTDNSGRAFSNSFPRYSHMHRPASELSSNGQDKISSLHAASFQAPDTIHEHGTATDPNHHRPKTPLRTVSVETALRYDATPKSPPQPITTGLSLISEPFNSPTFPRRSSSLPRDAEPVVIRRRPSSRIPVPSASLSSSVNNDHLRNYEQSPLSARPPRYMRSPRIPATSPSPRGSPLFGFSGRDAPTALRIRKEPKRQNIPLRASHSTPDLHSDGLTVPELPPMPAQFQRSVSSSIFSPVAEPLPIRHHNDPAGAKHEQWQVQTPDSPMSPMSPMSPLGESPFMFAGQSQVVPATYSQQTSSLNPDARTAFKPFASHSSPTSHSPALKKIQRKISAMADALKGSPPTPKPSVSDSGKLETSSTPDIVSSTMSASRSTNKPQPKSSGSGKPDGGDLYNTMHMEELKKIFAEGPRDDEIGTPDNPLTAFRVESTPTTPRGRPGLHSKRSLTHLIKDKFSIKPGPSAQDAIKVTKLRARGSFEKRDRSASRDRSSSQVRGELGEAVESLERVELHEDFSKFKSTLPADHDEKKTLSGPSAKKGMRIFSNKAKDKGKAKEKEIEDADSNTRPNSRVVPSAPLEHHAAASIASPVDSTASFNQQLTQLTHGDEDQLAEVAPFDDRLTRVDTAGSAKTERSDKPTVVKCCSCGAIQGDAQHRDEKFDACLICNKVYYCSKECRKAHKPECDEQLKSLEVTEANAPWALAAKSIDFPDGYFAELVQQWQPLFREFEDAACGHEESDFVASVLAELGDWPADKLVLGNPVETAQLTEFVFRKLFNVPRLEPGTELATQHPAHLWHRKCVMLFCIDCRGSCFSCGRACCVRRALRNRIYTGKTQTPEMIAASELATQLDTWYKPGRNDPSTLVNCMDCAKDLRPEVANRQYCPWCFDVRTSEDNDEVAFEVRCTQHHHMVEAGMETTEEERKAHAAVVEKQQWMGVHPAMRPGGYFDENGKPQEKWSKK